MSGCALRRFNGHGAPERPANKVLHSENEKNLKDLIALRAQQDNGIYNPRTASYTTPTLELDNYFKSNEDLSRGREEGCSFCPLEKEKEKEKEKDERTRWAIPSASTYVSSANASALTLHKSSTN